MNLKKVNDFFGYSLYAVGALRIVLIILTFLNFGMSFADLVNQSDLSNTNLVTLFAGIIGIAQIILAIAAVVMIFVNLRKEPKVVKGYLY